MKILNDARAYEEEHGRLIREEERPLFHLSARTGWMNDPNGLSRYGGQYHLFYQYHPFDSHWGTMYWGHAVSDDLLRWDYRPAALAPDMPYDGAGCFSGCAIELPDGRHMLSYTGVAQETDENGQLHQVQTQNLAFGDGTDYQKYGKNPVLTAADLPEGGSRADFRDPKIWREEDGSYRMVVANDDLRQAPRGGGRILLYRSDDALRWEYAGCLAENKGRLGLMWECPDFFRLNGRDVLLVSAQDMLPEGFEYHNGDGTFYLLGKYDPETMTYREESNHAIDYGIDFYAPQTILTPDGRRVMIGWMQNWDTCNQYMQAMPWFGQMSLPRELSVKNGILYQQPLGELEKLRGHHVSFDRVELENEERALPGISGRMADIEVELEPFESGGHFHRFVIRFAKNGEYYTGVSFRPHESVLKIDRKFSGSRRAVIHQRRAKVRHEDGHLKLRLVLDRFSVEIFVNDGEKVMSATISTPPDAREITFCADGKTAFRADYYSLG